MSNQEKTAHSVLLSLEMPVHYVGTVAWLIDQVMDDVFSDKEASGDKETSKRAKSALYYLVECLKGETAELAKTLQEGFDARK